MNFKVNTVEKKMAILNETKKSTKFKQTLFGGRKNIFTLCIASAENPKDVKLSAEENKQRTKNLLEDLKRLRKKSKL